jgi:beta-galactosidase/beta-glucuronidase
MGKSIPYTAVSDTYIFEEHPDPSWARRNWISLDGIWKIRHKGSEVDIHVPFPVGSETSGVDFRDSGTFVYARSFELRNFDSEKCAILHIGASDYETIVSVNGVEMGRHTGGYASFSRDISKAAKNGENSLEITVRDSHSPFQVRGKQTFLCNPFLVWYAGISGIWQNVWLEVMDKRHLQQVDLKPDFGRAVLEGSAKLAIPPSAMESKKTAEFPKEYRELSLDIEITCPCKTKKIIQADSPDESGAFNFIIPFSEIGPEIWSDEHPNLYGVRYHLRDGNSEIDIVESYFGLRSIELERNGFKINGARVYLRMVLDQGYYPGGVYTPTDRSILETDIRSIKAMGFNGARIHEKAESPYFHYLCDKLGLYTSFEMPSFYLPSKRAFAAYESELKELIVRDSTHPSCIVRMLFNETWGIWGIYGKHSKTRKFVLRMIDLTKEMDPTRPVIDNSGWEHLRTDIVDFHHYLRTASLARDTYRRIMEADENTLHGFSIRRVLAFYLRNQISTKTRSLFLEQDTTTDHRSMPLFLSEYGGFGWYDTENKTSIIENIEEYTRDIIDSRLFCGYCYTQLYDVGAEVNGLLTFKREPKVNIDQLRAVNLRGKDPA